MDDMRQEFLMYAHFRPPTWIPTTSLSQPRYAHVSAYTTTLVNQCSADLMSRSCVHKRLPNRTPFACRNSFTMLLQIPTSTAAGEKVGYRRQLKSTWFDEECHQAAIEKNDAYQATLQSAGTRAVYKKYRCLQVCNNAGYPKLAPSCNSSWCMA